MNPPMDDRRALAEIERFLVRDDPELASRMDALNGQFAEVRSEPRERSHPHDWRWVVALVVAVVALLGMILTAVLMAPPASRNSETPPPIGRAPAVSVPAR
ncbi:DUF3040 domain-containing protein [Streptomyces sp. PKU-EA00015]|uniref:DUF3040 domain-containing protein n=1 Tax=Streptomyces sp. PKU-EA00015 TaxID=2748326 RepID=UPI0015A3E0BC|nr:DUF3040 domain-containing protein [Streptomyces sp. PKU-EA00015]NWF29084.1 DUF3040 domain-containing protein [Streptomyces sp. PKU-EA00015]